MQRPIGPRPIGPGPAGPGPTGAVAGTDAVAVAGPIGAGPCAVGMEGSEIILLMQGFAPVG